MAPRRTRSPRSASATATGAARSSRPGSRTSDGAPHRVRCPAAARARSRCACASTQEVDRPALRRHAPRRARRRAVSPSSVWDTRTPARFAAGEEVTCASRSTTSSPRAATRPPRPSPQGGVDRPAATRMLSFVVTGTRRTEGVVDLPYEVAIERAQRAVDRGRRPVSARAAHRRRPHGRRSRARPRSATTRAGLARSRSRSPSPTSSCASSAPSLGYLWQLMRPLMLFGVLYIVFSQFFEVGDDVEFYPVALLLGIVLFTFLAEATAGLGAQPRRAREPGAQDRVPAPRGAAGGRADRAVQPRAEPDPGVRLPARRRAAARAGAGSSCRSSSLLLALFATGLAMLLSALFVRYRDVEPIWDVVLQVCSTRRRSSTRCRW